MTQTDESADLADRKRRYRWLLTVEAFLLTATISAFIWLPQMGVCDIWPTTVVMTALLVWHIVVFPICFSYLIGNPIVMTLEPLYPSAESRAFWRQLRERPALSDDAFYSHFYETSGFSREMLARARRALRNLDTTIDRVIPTDLLWLLDAEYDLAWFLEELEKEFCIRFTAADHARVDGTLGNLLQLLHERINAHSE